MNRKEFKEGFRNHERLRVSGCKNIEKALISCNADAEVIIKDIMTTLSGDEGLHSNVRDSSPSAYEAVVDEKVDATIMDGMFSSMMAGDSERAEFYSELSENKTVKTRIRNSVIRKIKDFLLSA